MTEVIFGELEEIVPRIAWPNEALNFTPWLSANLTRLGAAIGLQMSWSRRDGGWPLRC